MRKTITFSYLFVLLLSILNSTSFAQAISITTLGSPYTQNFDVLSNTAGSTTNNLTIVGWFMTESGGGARDNEQYAVDNGGSTTGDTYSYGAAGSTERALGQLRSGTLIPLFGAAFTNNTGSTITSLTISYTGEEWRLGTAGRTDQMNFEYSLNATDLVTGTWTNVAALNFITPDDVTVGAKNGNAAGDRTSLSTTINGLSIPNGATFWIRWNDTDATGADDGLAVDDFSLTANGPVAVATTTTLSSSLNPSFTGDPVTFTATVISGGNPVTTGTVTFSEGVSTLASNVAVNGSGQAAFTTSSLTEGSHIITATYNGTANFATSNGSLTQVANNHTTVNGNTFCNPGSITINDAAAATPYPSNIFVSGLSGTILKVTVTLNNITHASASNIDMLLVGPSGQTFILFSDAGGSNAVSNLTITLDDAAASLLSASSLSSGTFKPANYDVVQDFFPSPAPAGTYNSPASGGASTFATVFNGANPNGTWKLFVVDDAAGSSGTIAGGWCLNITTSCTPTNTISQIQGSGPNTPFPYMYQVSVNGIVTAVKTDGFFLQTPDGLADSDPNTSEGIFVFTGSTPPASVAIGNSICVSANVIEYFAPGDPAVSGVSMTELVSPTITLLSTGNPLPAPVVISSADLQVNNITNLEKYEGMRVQVNSLTVTGPTQGTIDEVNATATSNGLFYGVIIGTARPFREPGVRQPDPLPAGSPAGVTRWDGNPEILGVNTKAQPGATLINVSANDVVTNLVGPLDYTNRYYTIDVDASAAPIVTSNNPGFISVPAAAANEVTIATLNLQRFYDQTDDPSITDPILTATAFNNRLNKTSLAIRNVLNLPDVIGVQEVENFTTLQAIAAKVNSDAGASNPNYVAYLTEGNDPTGIDVGFLVKSSKISVVDVTQLGKTDTYADPNTGSTLTFERPPLMLRATFTKPRCATPIPFTVIVNHFRSLSGIDDASTGNSVRAKRKAQAEYLANTIQSRQTASAAEKIISVGDYNAYEFNDGYVDVMGTIKGSPTPATQVVLASSDLVNPNLTNLTDGLPAAQRYTYSFSGSASALDHILVSQSVSSEVSSYQIARLGADFAEVFRNSNTGPERITDHDVPVAYFNFSCPSASTNPSGTGAANPSTVAPGGPTLLTVTVTPGTNPASTGITVTGDLTSIGGSATQTFFDNGTNGDVTAGDNIFSFNATVSNSTTSGGKILPISIADAQSRTGSTSISLTVSSLSSTNANLSNLTISSGTLTPAFQKGVTNYHDAVANAVTSVTVTPTAEDAGSTIKVNGNTVTSGSATPSIPLNVGDNPINVVVTAADGVTTKTYAIIVNRGAAGTNWYVSTTGDDHNDGSSAHPFRTMQHANDTSIVHNGDIINVLAGDYTEFVDVTKSLRFYGPNADVSPNGGSRNAEAVLHASSAAISPHFANGTTVFEVRTSGTTVEVKGFKLMDGNPLHDGHMHRDGSNLQNISVLFEKNWVRNADHLFAGTLTRWSNIIVRDNFFDNINYSPNVSSAIQLNDAVNAFTPPTYAAYPATVTATIEDNVINTTEFAGILLDNIASASVQRNKLSNMKGEAGIQLAGGMNTATVNMNEITNANTASAPANDDGGIKIYGSDFASGGSINITNNTVTTSLNGFVVKSGQTVGSTVHVHNNSFGSTTNKSIYHGGSGTLDATCNWHGTNSCAGVITRIFGSANVTYDPFLNSATDTDAGTIGFQPAAGTCVTCAASPIAALTPAIRELHLYPVPVIDILKVKYTSPEQLKVSITIIDELGRISQKENTIAMKGINIMSFSVYKLQKGIYTVIIDDGKTQTHQKMIKL